MQWKIDIRIYDIDNLKLLNDKNTLYKIYIPSLAEKRPSLLRGDLIYLQPTTDYLVEFIGVIHFVHLDHILLSFHKDIS